jgi:hypothetical protein
MTNSESLVAAIFRLGSSRLRDDVAWKLDVADRGPLPAYVAEAFVDAYNDAASNRERTLVRNCEDVLIAAGFYAPIPADAEVASTGRDRSPVRKSVRYEPASSLDEWIRE